jgi:tetratricopeptide (TPR) repeat protein
MPANAAKPTTIGALDRWWAAMPGLAIVLLVVMAYLPSLSGQFIWDDDFHVTKCEPLRSLAGLGRIWFEPGATQQYYPLTWSTFWIDYHLWGLRPFAYHVENIFLHAINAVLLWRILRRLNVTGAWLGAALFALHPVCVESVAWISERKNTLSGLFFLLCLRAAIEFWLPQNAAPAKSEQVENPKTDYGAWKFYWLTLLLYLCAVWSKSVTAVLPGVFLLLVWWKRGGSRWKDWLLVVPFLAIGLTMGLIMARIEHGFVLEAGNLDEWKLLLPEKFIIAGRALWFYLAKLCWPYPLVFIYPRWILHASEPLAYLPLAAAVTGGGLLWWKRKTWGRPVLVALGYFVIVLLPALGFINIFPFRYSFVADHFQYLAAMGPLTMGATGITLLLARLAKNNPYLQFSIAGAILAVLSVFTWRQTGIYHDREILWRHTLAHNPSSWMAHDNLGLYLTELGRFDEAESHYREAIRIRPNDHIAYYDLGLQSAMRGNLDDAVQNFNKTLELFPRFAMAHYQIANVLAREGNLVGAIENYRATLQEIPTLVLGYFNLANALARNGNADGAMFAYKRTLELQPDYAPAHVRLGGMLSAKGDMDGAISHYRAALEIEPNSVEALANLGNALVAKSRFDEAITCYRVALQLDPDSPVIHFNLSVALSKQGKTSEAEAERAEARRLELRRPAAR